MAIVNPVTSSWGLVDYHARNRYLYVVRFTGLNIGNAEGEDSDLMLPCIPLSAAGRGTLRHIKVTVQTSTDFDFALRNTAGKTSTYNDETQITRWQNQSAGFKTTDNMETALWLPSGVMYGVIKNNVAGPITAVQVWYTVDLDRRAMSF